ncbi:MAG: competence protein ComEC, partial [Candidatus Hydrogenedentes bacterium]|nr:competence protein ComEC [Candidatus Hydrogenedentota bacterium]
PTGDIEALAERALLPFIPRVDVLKVPHHGSTTSSTETFLDATAPQIAIASTRDQPPRVPMREEVNARYEAREIPVYRTDYHGGIRVRQRNGILYVETARGQRGYSLAPKDN